MSTDPSITNNAAVQPCTLDTCPLSLGIIKYQPNICGNASFLAIFGALFLLQLYIGIRYKTWTYLVAIVLGLLLETIGYIGRLQLHTDPFNFNYFLVYLVCLTIGPAFLTAAIYITFTRIVHSCGEELSIIRPSTCSAIFMTCDFVCLVLQAVGGAITSTSAGFSDEAKAMRQTGVDIMISGLSFQVLSLFAFMLYASIYSWRWHFATILRARRCMSSARVSLWWRGMVIGLTIASIAIFVRCVFRVAELRDGFDSPLANDEAAFMTLEGSMIIISCLCLTIGHPGLCLDIPWKLPARLTQKRSNENSGLDIDLNTHK